MTRKLYEIAADILEAQASMIEMSPESLEQTLSTVFVTLQKMKIAEDSGFMLEVMKPAGEPVEEIPQAIDPKDSIQEDKVICLECGTEMRQLTVKHLSFHGLNVREYKKKYGFPLKQSLSAKALSKARSKAAKKRGLPEKLLRFQAQRKQDKMEAAMMEKTATSEAPGAKAKTKAPAKAKALAKTNAPTKRVRKNKTE
jgi:predicted transcriptional regulator